MFKNDFKNPNIRKSFFKFFGCCRRLQEKSEKNSFFIVMTTDGFFSSAQVLIFLTQHEDATERERERMSEKEWQRKYESGERVKKGFS